MFEVGDKVSWWYVHHYNSRSCADRVKHGVVEGLSRNGAIVLVKFPKNKALSRIPAQDLILK